MSEGTYNFLGTDMKLSSCGGFRRVTSEKSFIEYKSDIPSLNFENTVLTLPFIAFLLFPIPFYEALPEVLGNMGAMAFISGEYGNKGLETMGTTV